DGIFRRGEVEHAYGVRNALFQGESAVGVHFALILLAVGEAARAADTAVHTRHALYEIGVQHALGLAEQSRAACLDAVAGDGLVFEVRFALFLDGLGDRVGDAAAPG